MKARKVLSAGFGLNTASAAVQTGTLHQLLVKVSGITATLDSDKEAAAALILENMAVELRRQLGDGRAVTIVEGVEAGFFRQYTNLKFGYMSGLDGAMIDLGVHQLGGDNRLDLTLDWSGVPALPGDASASGATVEVFAIEHLRPVDPVAFIYRGTAQNATTERHSILVRNLIGAYAHGISIASVTLGIGGSESVVPGAVVTAISAANYRHEDEASAPLAVVYEASRARAREVTPEITLEATAPGGTLVQVGYIG